MGRQKVIAYYGRGLSDAEKNYNICHLELLAAVSTILHFREMLQGCEFELWSDCKALEALLHRQQKVPKLQRLVLAIQEFTFKFVYVKGTKHRLPDALSRREYQQTTDTELDDAVHYGILLDSPESDSECESEDECTQNPPTLRQQELLEDRGEFGDFGDLECGESHLVSVVQTEREGGLVVKTAKRKAKQRGTPRVPAQM